MQQSKTPFSILSPLCLISEPINTLARDFAPLLPLYRLPSDYNNHRNTVYRIARSFNPRFCLRESEAAIQIGVVLLCSDRLNYLEGKKKKKRANGTKMNLPPHIKTLTHAIQTTLLPSSLSEISCINFDPISLGCAPLQKKKRILST